MCTVRLFFLHSFQHKYLELFKSSMYRVMLPKHTSQTRCLRHFQRLAGVSVTFHGNWSHQLTRTYHEGPPEVLMKNGNRRQLFSLRTLSPLPHERALSNASFSRISAWMSSPPGTDTPIGQTGLSALELQRTSGPLRRRVRSERKGLCHSCCTMIVLLFFVAPEKRQHEGGP